MAKATEPGSATTARSGAQPAILRGRAAVAAASMVFAPCPGGAALRLRPGAPGQLRAGLREICPSAWPRKVSGALGRSS
eukprot:8308309-Alexandrium_andersonii.AAC.1